MLADRGLDARTVGNVAAQAYPDLQTLSAQADPAAMSVEVAQVLDTSVGALPSTVGVANLVTFPDGLTGGAHIGALGGPLLLTTQQSLSPKSRPTSPPTPAPSPWPTLRRRRRHRPRRPRHHRHRHQHPRPVTRQLTTGAS